MNSHVSGALIWSWAVALVVVSTGFMVNRRFHRSTYRAELVVEGFTKTLRDIVDPHSVAHVAS